MNHRQTCLVLSAAVLLGAAEVPEENDQVAAAVHAAMQWLQLVDEGKYPESWADAAEYFRNAVTPAKWAHSMQAVRVPLGEVLSRAVTNTSYRTTLPGAPDGEYVVIQFATSFSNKAMAVETVTPMLATDGTWRVSGYYIR